MSVLARFRQESQFEVRDNARNIEIFIIRLCMNDKYFPKRYRHVISSDVIHDAHKLVDHIDAANLLPLNEIFYIDRQKHQKKALIRINYIYRKIILGELLGFKIPESFLYELGKALQKEEALIKKWIESDKVRIESKGAKQ